MPVNMRLAQVGIAKQTAKGTPAAQPTFVFGVGSGKVVESKLTETPVALTFSSRMSEATVREQLVPGGTWDTMGFSRSLGLLLLAALGTDVVTGSSDPYTHTITAPTADVNWLTLFGRYGTDYVSIADCKLDSLKLDWALGALKVSAVLMGITMTLGLSAWTPTNTDDATVPGMLYESGAGAANMQLNGANARIMKGTITISNGLKAIVPSYKVTPDDFEVGEQTAQLAATVVPDDLTLYKTILTGSGAGTTPQSVPYYGSFSAKFIEAVTSANHDLTISANRVSMLIDFPDANPKGGSAQLAVAGNIWDPRTGAAALTAVLRNAIPSY